MALLVRVEKSGETIKRAGYATSPVRLGRNPLNEIYLEDPVVSQWHALIRFDEAQGQLILMDLGSTNGTTYNGAPLAPHVPVMIRPNDMISIGPLTIVLALANVPRELLDSGRGANFDAGMGGGKATIMLSSEQAKTQFFGGGVAPTMMLLPGTEPPPVAAPSQETYGKLEEAVSRTRPAYEAYREAWGEVLRQLRFRLESMPPTLRDQVVFGLKAELPQISLEPEFQDLLSELGVSLGGETVDVGEWLHRLKHGTGSTVPHEPINTRVAMERVGALLETFSESFVSLRRGYEQFGEDMALRLAQEETPLSAAHDYRGVLAVLLDWNVEGGRVLDALKRAFADLAIHQVALLHGFVEGTRDLIQQVGPEALSTGRSAVMPQGNGGSSFFLGRKGRLWKLYERVHRSLTEEDRFTRVIFGRTFARAYFDVTGGKLQDG